MIYGIWTFVKNKTSPIGKLIGLGYRIRRQDINIYRIAELTNIRIFKNRMRITVFEVKKNTFSRIYDLLIDIGTPTNPTQTTARHNNPRDKPKAR